MDCGRILGGPHPTARSVRPPRAHRPPPARSSGRPRYHLGSFLKGQDEADVPAEQQEARQAARLPPSHVDPSWQSDPEGAPPARSGALVGLSGRLGTVQGRRTFQQLARSDRRASSGPVAVRFLPKEDAPGEVLVAYSVSRKVGGAVVRNRCRRRLRAIAAGMADELASGAYLIGVGPGVRGLAFDELKERVSDTMRRASGATR